VGFVVEVAALDLFDGLRTSPKMTPADLEFDLVTREPDIPILPITSDGLPLRFIIECPLRGSQPEWLF
jgi:hypothetical protein